MLVKERIEAWIRSGSETLYLATRGWAYIRFVRQISLTISSKKNIINFNQFFVFSVSI
jgi:hypothetical protein